MSIQSVELMRQESKQTIIPRSSDAVLTLIGDWMTSSLEMFSTGPHPPSGRILLNCRSLQGTYLAVSIAALSAELTV